LHFIETVADAAEEAPVIAIETVEDIVEHAETLKNFERSARVVAEAMVRRVPANDRHGQNAGADAGLSGKPWKDMTELEVRKKLSAISFGGFRK